MDPQNQSHVTKAYPPQQHLDLNNNPVDPSLLIIDPIATGDQPAKTTKPSPIVAKKRPRSKSKTSSPASNPLLNSAIADSVKTAMGYLQTLIKSSESRKCTD